MCYTVMYECDRASYGDFSVVRHKAVNTKKTYFHPKIRIKHARNWNIAENICSEYNHVHRRAAQSAQKKHNKPKYNAYFNLQLTMDN